MVVGLYHVTIEPTMCRSCMVNLESLGMLSGMGSILVSPYNISKRERKVYLSVHNQFPSPILKSRLIFTLFQARTISCFKIACFSEND